MRSADGGLQNEKLQIETRQIGIEKTVGERFIRSRFQEFRIADGGMRNLATVNCRTHNQRASEHQD
ncbi:MAG: hypothetical protein D6713_02360 [Deltaproteobacteria bacterium]|nr:MAG: hypothetical protein D6713_02360 [Deltaproteobacteria bacterium]